MTSRATLLGGQWRHCPGISALGNAPEGHWPTPPPFVAGTPSDDGWQLSVIPLTTTFVPGGQVKHKPGRATLGTLGATQMPPVGPLGLEPPSLTTLPPPFGAASQRSVLPLTTTFVPGGHVKHRPGRATLGTLGAQHCGFAAPRAVEGDEYPSAAFSV